MKLFRLRTILMMVLLCLVAGLSLAQDTIVEPNPLAPFDYNRDRVQYSGLEITLAQTSEVTLPIAMETALVPCGDDVTGPCDMIATTPEDIVGVWKQYLGNPRINAPGGVAYIRYNADRTFVWADSIENTAQPTEGYPAGTFSFDGAEFIIGPAAGTPPPCDIPPHYQLRVLKYDGQPVALSYVPIHDDCLPRSQDLIQAGIWVAE